MTVDNPKFGVHNSGNEEQLPKPLTTIVLDAGQIRDRRIIFLLHGLYEGTVAYLPEDQFLPTVRECILQTTNRILTPNTLQKPESEAAFVYDLFGLLGVLPPEDVEDAQFIRLIKERLLADLGQSALPVWRSAAIQHTATYVQSTDFQGKGSYRLGHLFLGIPELRHEIISAMLSQSGRIESIEDRQRLANFFGEVEKKNIGEDNLSMPDEYYSEVVRMLLGGINYLSTTESVSKTHKDYAIILARLADAISFNHIKRGELADAGNLMTNLSTTVMNCEFQSDLQILVVARYYESLVGNLLSSLKDELSADVQAGIYKEVLSRMEESFLIPLTISYLWQAPETLIPTVRKLELVEPFFNPPLKDSAAGYGEPGRGNLGIYYELLGHSNVPEEIQALFRSKAKKR